MQRTRQPAKPELRRWSSLIQRTGLLVAGVSLLLTLGCSSRSEELTEQAVQQAQAGEAEEAAHRLIEAVKEDPELVRADTLLRQVLPRAYESQRRKIADHETAERWDEVVEEYDAMSALSDAAASLPKDYPTVDVRKERRRAAEKAAREHFAQGQRHFDRQNYEQAGEEFLAADQFVSGFKQSKTRAAEAFYERGSTLYETGDFRAAAESFERASSTVPGFEDASTRYEEARQKALVSVVVVPFEDESGRNLGSILADESISKIMDKDPEFLEFVAPAQVAEGLDLTLVSRDSAVKVGQDIGVDAFIFGKVLDVRLNRTGERTRGPMANAVEDSEGNVYRARWWCHSRTSSATVSASYQIVDVNSGRVEEAETLRDRLSDTATWQTYEGDEVATHDCPDEDGRQHPQDPSVLLDEIASRLSSSFATQLYQHFEFEG